MQGQFTTTTDTTKWSDLLREAVSIPGTILEAYTAFHGYSVGNQMLAMLQCRLRGIQPGPLCTYPGWKAKGRQVRENLSSRYKPATANKMLSALRGVLKTCHQAGLMSREYYLAASSIPNIGAKPKLRAVRESDLAA